MKLKENVQALSEFFYKGERLLITLLRGRAFVLIGRFMRENGSLTLVAAIMLTVSANNLFIATRGEEFLSGYWAKNSDKEAVIASTKTISEDAGLALGGTEALSETGQLATAVDTEAQREVQETDLNDLADDGEELLSEDAIISDSDYSGRDDGNTQDIQIYVVEKGDTLNIIAQKNNVSTSTILWANDLSDANEIQAGDTLFVLPVSGVKHEIKKTDTIESIAREYKAEAEEILAFNSLPANGEIEAGQEIIIPGGEKEEKNPDPQPTVVVSNGPTFPDASVITPQVNKNVKDSYFTHPAAGARRTQGIHRTNAVDLAAPLGTPIHAAAKGVITKVGTGGWNGGYGNHVVMRHPNGVITLYAHLSSVDVKKGDEVKQGKRIGRMGSTGRSTGSHVHFEVRGARNPF